MVRRGCKRLIVDRRGADARGRHWFMLSCGHWIQRKPVKHGERRAAYCRDCSARSSPEVSGLVQ